MTSWRDQFQAITESLLASDGVNDFTNDKYSNTACGCQPKFPGELICRDSKCINFATQTECVKCRESCCNKRIQNKEYAKLNVLHTPGKGHGLFAAENMTENQFVMEYVGELISTEEFNRRSSERGRLMEHQYIMSLKNNVYMDAGRKGSISRFINHSCEPNCYVEVWTVQNRLRVGIFTMCGITNGTELTFDYQWKPSSRPPTKCHCGTESCRGYLEVFSKGELESLKVRRGLWRKGGEPVSGVRCGSPRLIDNTVVTPLTVTTSPSVLEPTPGPVPVNDGAVNVPITMEWLIAPSPTSDGGSDDESYLDANSRTAPTAGQAHKPLTLRSSDGLAADPALSQPLPGDVYTAQGLLVPHALIGRRVKVWWEGNLAYLEADVESYNAKTNKYLCR
jgi:hypothetical protein